MTPQEIISEYPTKYEQGFIQSEIDDVIKNNYPNIDMKKFNEALMGITVQVLNGEMVIYRRDIELALYCGLEGRRVRDEEFD